MIQSLTDLLPKNNIKISNDVFLSLAMNDDNIAKIENGRIKGYFEGDVMGLSDQQRNIDPKNLVNGDLNLDDNGSPF